MTTKLRKSRIGRIVFCLMALIASAFAQDSPQATVGAEIGEDGTGKIVVEAKGVHPKPPVFYTASASTDVTVGGKKVTSTTNIDVKVIQGEPQTISIGINGPGRVAAVNSQQPVESWSVRNQGPLRFLDVKVPKETKEIQIAVTLESEKFDDQLDGAGFAIDLPHVSPGKSVGFRSVVKLNYLAAVSGEVIAAEGFTALEAENQFETTTGGKLSLRIARSGAKPGPVEFSNAKLTGTVDEEGNFAQFEFTATAKVTEDEAVIPILGGSAAASDIGGAAGYRIRLSPKSGNATFYELVFPKSGQFPVKLNFVAVMSENQEWRSLAFDILTASAVTPLSLSGIDAGATFQKGTSTVPVRQGANWNGFVPADGLCRITWKPKRETGEGKLFFTTSGMIETRVGAGLLRQTHQIDFQVLQGELTAVSMEIDGPGEVVAVDGESILGWEVQAEGDGRRLEIKLSQPISGASKISIRSQSTVDALPAQAEGMRLTPIGAVRHSGYIRLSNEGSVSLDPGGLQGLTQLSPEQYPAEPIPKAFVYRFPSAEFDYSIGVDRIQPVVDIKNELYYRISDTDRTIYAEIELQIDEAPIGEWTVLIPDGYEVASVNSPVLRDYLLGTEVVDGQRTLRFDFVQDVVGVQLIKLALESGEPAAAGEWVLPPVRHPDAASVKGQIKVSTAPGYRVEESQTSLLSRMSHNPGDSQLHYRIRESGWDATLTVTRLAQSVVADVFHRYTLKDRTSYADIVINYFVTGAPISELRVQLPAGIENINATSSEDVRQEDLDEENILTVTLQQPVMGAVTLAVSFEERISGENSEISPGTVQTLGVEGEQGYIHIMSPVLVSLKLPENPPAQLLDLAQAEVPAQLQLLAPAPGLATWQYTQRGFGELKVGVEWFEPGETEEQVIEFASATSEVASDGQSRTDITYTVNSRGKSTLRVDIPDETRLWEARIRLTGSSQWSKVNARKEGELTRIPLPETESNQSVDVLLRLARDSGDDSMTLRLPRVHGAIMKTEWNLKPADQDRVLVARGGSSTVSPPKSNLPLTGFGWIATGSGLIGGAILAVLVLVGIWLSSGRDAVGAIGLALLLAAAILSFAGSKMAWDESGRVGTEIQVSLPVMIYNADIEADQDEARLKVGSVHSALARVSWIGVIAVALGIAGYIASYIVSVFQERIRAASIALVAGGILFQHGGATPFLILLGILLVLVFILPRGRAWVGSCVAKCKDWSAARAEKKAAAKKAAESSPPPVPPGTAGTAGTSALVIGALLLMFGQTSDSVAAPAPEGFSTADSLSQTWSIDSETKRLSGSGTIQVSGKSGDQFLLLTAPAVLTNFDGGDLRVTRQQVPALKNLAYIITIPASDPPPPLSPAPPQEPVDPFAAPAPPPAPVPAEPAVKTFTATFEFQLEIENPQAGFQIPTGTAAVHQLEVTYNEADWEIVSPAAVRTEQLPAAGTPKSSAKLLLAPQLGASLGLRARMRDVENEETTFYVEGAHIYLPSPGVVDGKHRLTVKPAQGVVSELEIQVPAGLTVGSVDGPVGSWQFDAESGKLSAVIEPPQAQPFAIGISTQRGLDPLPADVEVAPLTVPAATGETGFVALGFGDDAQPETVSSQALRPVNPNDFDASLLPEGVALNQVFAYGKEGGSIELRVASVPPEIRVRTTEDFFVGVDELSLDLNFIVSITRAGVFQLSFPIPDGLELESLSGPQETMRSWNESTDENGQRQVVIHLNTKTMGQASFTVTFRGAQPVGEGEWQVPRFTLNEATRQSGGIGIRTDPGIELREVAKTDASRRDPAQINPPLKPFAYAMAYEANRKNWSLTLDISRRDADIVGNTLHEVTLREGQTRNVITTKFEVRHAKIPSLRVRLPITDEEEIKTIQADGGQRNQLRDGYGARVSSIVREAEDSDVWVIQFDKLFIGHGDLRIEYERRFQRDAQSETLTPAEFPDVRDMSYFFGVRPAERIEVVTGETPEGWRIVDWTRVPAVLRQLRTNLGMGEAPILTVQASAPEQPMVVGLNYLDLAPALNLRVIEGQLTTIISPLGEQMTEVNLIVAASQRSSLDVKLPDGAKLFSIFVNGSSVNTVVEDGKHRFYILAGPKGEGKSHVRFFYLMPGEGIGRVQLRGPELNAPLEDVKWQVIAPKGFQMTDEDGNMDWDGTSQQLPDFTAQTYVSKAEDLREYLETMQVRQYKHADNLKASGDQKAAYLAYEIAANQPGSQDTGEDAQVQMRELNLRQAMVSLISVRQLQTMARGGRMINPDEAAQLEQAVSRNPVMRGDANFDTNVYNQLLQGQDTAGLNRIAQHLSNTRTSDTAPPAIVFPLPAENRMYTFNRTIQVSGSDALQLDLRFSPDQAVSIWRMLAMALILAVLIGAIVFLRRRSPRSTK